LEVLVKFAKNQDYKITIDPTLNPSNFWGLRSDVEKFVASLDLHGHGKPIEIRDYQIDAIEYALGTKRSILVAATSSGKSAMIYSIIRYHQTFKRRTLLIVPNISLVKQMYSDFADYSSANGWSVEDNVQMLYSGKERVFDSNLVISTWQTILSMMKTDKKAMQELVDYADVIIGDECHQLRSTEVSKVIESFVKTEWRVGTTGTLDGVQLNVLTLTGLFGPAFQVVTAKELIDAGQATPVEIRIVVIKHPEVYCKALKGMKYQEEVNQIISNSARNKFIAKLAAACTGNTLILYNFVERHGNLIHEKLLETVAPGRNVYYIHGGVDADDRENIRKIVEKEDNAIILATSSLMSTGTNIPSIANLILAIPGRSNIRIRQSIGRGLRLKDGKTVCKVFDLTDDYRVGKWRNTAMKHLDERIAVYTKEQFDMKVIDAKLEY
jgi:superfamily II DNA or RNA helicase